MLTLRPNCECCGAGLPADVAGAFICSFECTFCAACAADVLGGVCPNCGGDLVVRPTRTGNALARYPASNKPVVRPGGCPG